MTDPISDDPGFTHVSCATAQDDLERDIVELE